MRTRRTALLVLFAVFGTLLVPASIERAAADGNPDLLVTKTMPKVALLGAEIPVSVSVANPSGPDGYNLTVTETLPAGASYVDGSSTLDPEVLVQGDGSTVVVWSNIADPLTGATVALDFAITTGVGFDPGDSVIATTAAYADRDAATVPDVDPSTGVVTGDFSGSDTAARSTRLLAFSLTKSEPSEEGELLRGVHDQQTVYTLRVDNNLVGASSDLSIIDYLPASLEFLGCGGVDNSSSIEYPGAGALNPGNEPVLTNPCITPSSIATVNLDPDGLGAADAGVYTRLTWNAATLATALAAGGTFQMDYLAAIPLRQNVQTSVGDPTANLDNNTGALTTETEDDLESYALVSGTYDPTGGAATDTDYHVVTAEDLSVHKTVDADEFGQDDTPTFTLKVETSEYVPSSGSITVTDRLPSALDFVGSTPAADGAVVQPDGSTEITWTLPGPSTANETSTITVDTLVRDTHRNVDGSDGTPVSSGDAHTNTVSASGELTVLIDGTGSTTTATFSDESSASQTSPTPAIVQEVSAPVGGTLACGDGTGVVFTGATAASHRPGDRVCWRLVVDFPPALDTLSPTVTSLLPDGFGLESWSVGATSDVDASALDFTDDGPAYTWEVDDQDVGGPRLELILSTIIDTPDAAGDGDVLSNVMKLHHLDADGEVFQLRAQASTAWAEPQLALDKGVSHVNAVAVPDAPADGVTVEEGDAVTFRLDVSNTGTVSALDVTIRDVLPAEITCADISSVSDSGVCDATNGWIDWSPASNIDVGTGATTALSYDLTVPIGTSGGASLTNRAGVRRYDGETNTGTPFAFVPADNIDSSLTANTTAADDSSEVITSLPTLTTAVATSVTEAGNSATDEATIGETLSYTIEVDLPDAISYFDASLTDVLPDDKDLVESSVDVTLDGAALPAGFSLSADDATNAVTLDFPPSYAVPDGDDQALVVTFDALVIDVPGNARGSVSANQADFSFENAGGERREVNHSTEVEIVEPNISIGKDNDDPDGKVVAGQVVTYTIDVENRATGRVSVAHDTVVSDTIPDELVLLEAPGDPAEDGDTIAPDAGLWDATNRTITWTLGTMDPGDTTQLGYAIQIGDPLVAAGTLRNTAVVTTTSMSGTPTVERTSASPNGDAGGDGYTDTDSSDVVVPVLDIVKSASSLRGTVGSALTYTLDIELPAGVIAYDVTVLDDLPIGLVFESVSSVTCVQNGSSCSPDISTATPVVGGGDVAFFLGDMTSQAAEDRDLTIEYVAVIDDVEEADDGAILQNTAAVHWNEADTIAGTPSTPPAPGGFSHSSSPWSVVVRTDEPALSIDKEVAGQVLDTDERRAKPGDTLSYTITVTSSGTTAAYSATVRDIPTDESWLFTDTTATAGIVNTDADPAGGLEWLIDGPLLPGTSATITYDLVVPSTLTTADENDSGPEATNEVDVASYFAIAGPERVAHPGRSYRSYDDVTADRVDIELDLATIGGVVWFDVNGDGVQDASEPGLPDVDVVVTYLGADATPGGGDDEEVTVPTTADGSFSATRLPGGQYTVDVDEADPDFLSGVVASYDLDDTTISPNGLWSGTIDQDAAVTAVDFGYSGTGSIGDTVWFDQNRDATIDPGEARLGGVDVLVTWLGPDDSLGGGDDVAYHATTNASGHYLANNLPSGAFVVEVDTTTLPSGYVNVSDPGGENDDASTLTLAGGAADLSHDFGYAGTDVIGDLVWLDQDADGIQDGGEPGLGGVIVALTHFGPDGVSGGGDDSEFATSTDTSGAYDFTGLPPGVFEVEITGGVPANTTNSADPDTVAPGDGRSIVTLTAGVARLDQDFGFNATSVLGDRVWWDLDSDDVQDLDEPGLDGVEVTATYLGPDATLGTVDDQVYVTITTGDGDFLFTDVPDGDYTLEVTNGVPDGMNLVFDEDSGTTSPDGTISTTLASAHLTADFGYAGSGSIGDTVWFDTDSDGDVDPDDFGLADIGIEMTWLGPDDTLGGGDDITLTTETATDGSYLFAGLPAGAFNVATVSSTLGAGFVPTFDADSGTTGADARTSLVLSAAQVRHDQDFGFAGTSSMGDRVWFDRDGDGDIDADEYGLGSIVVEAFWTGPMQTHTFRTTTDAAGQYSIDNLPEGDYTVAIDGSTLPAGMSPTFDADGGFDSTSDLHLSAGGTDETQDFGYRGSATLGDTIWLDIDGDGGRGLDEPGVGGQRVDLRWQSGPLPMSFTTHTNTSGGYTFAGLPDGDFTVTVVGGIVDVAENSNDPDGSYDSTSDRSIVAGEHVVDQDFGYHGLHRLGDLVWMDHDRDGAIDEHEDGIPDVVIEVTWYGFDGVAGGGDDIAWPGVTTGADGSYVVDGLPEGTSVVAVSSGLPDGLDTPTYDADSGTTEPDATSTVIALGEGAANPVTDDDQDFGFAGSGVLGGAIWLSLDGDTVRGRNEPGVGDVGIGLTWAGLDATLGTDDDVVHAPERTDVDGSYAFSHLAPGLYAVSYDDADLEPGIEPYVDPDGGFLTHAHALVLAGQDVTSHDFGVAGNATLRGSVFVDANGDGLRSAGETPLSNVTVTSRWSGPAGPIDFTVTTDSDGNWTLSTMPPGDYLVLLGLDTVPPEMVPTLPVITELVVEPAGVAVANNALVPAGSIGDLVWHDDDRSGAVTPGEIGVERVRVNLANEVGDVVASTESALDGSYLFDRLTPGEYTVVVDASSIPDSMEIVATPADDDDDDHRTTVVLAAAAEVDTADFGLDQPVSDTAPALAFTGRSVADLVLLGGTLVWFGMLLSEGTRRRKPDVVQLEISSDGRRVII